MIKADKPRKNAPVVVKILSILRDIICVIAILIIIAAALCFALGYKPAIVMSGSMEPTIHTGSIVLIDQNDTTDIHKGDIIAFNIENTFVTHRVTGVDAEGIHTKGDGNQTADIWVLQHDNIVGKTVFWVPEAGYVANWLTSKQGIILIGGICAAIIIASFLKFTPPEEKEKEGEPTNEKGAKEKRRKRKAKKADNAAGKTPDAKPDASESSQDFSLKRAEDGKLYIGNTQIPSTKEELKALPQEKQVEVITLLKKARKQSENQNR